MCCRRGSATQGKNERTQKGYLKYTKRIKHKYFYEISNKTLDFRNVNF